MVRSFCYSHLTEHAHRRAARCQHQKWAPLAAQGNAPIKLLAVNPQGGAGLLPSRRITRSVNCLQYYWKILGAGRLSLPRPYMESNGTIHGGRDLIMGQVI